MEEERRRIAKELAEWVYTAEAKQVYIMYGMMLNDKKEEKREVSKNGV